MSIPLTHVILVILPVLVFGAERNSTCTTPNGEEAICTPIFSCLVLQQAIFSSEKSAIDFAKESQCGYDTEPLVCCGSIGFYNIKFPESSLLPDRSICGFSQLEDRIVGGQLTEIGEFPWMALLGYKNSNDNTSAGFKCGGTLINQRYVLTAAHCVRVSISSGLTLDIVRLGEWQISTEHDCLEGMINNECADPVIDLQIENKITHRNYSRRSGDNDIALLRLEMNVEYTDFVKPICLPAFNSPPPSAGTECIVCGWGTTENGSSSDYQLKLQLPIVSNSDCALKFKNRGQISDNQICAGGDQGKDACQGDSGGPLMGSSETKDQRKQWHHEGVIAWGIGCGGKNMPGVYTRTTKYLQWILDNMSEF